MQRLALLLLLVGAAILSPVMHPGSKAQAAELIYFNSPACSVCEQWDEEVGVLYSKTAEAQVLPLRTHNIHDDKPAELAFIKGVVFTPTFVMIENGQEVGRIVGYVKDYFFWEQMSGLVKKVQAVKSVQTTACMTPAKAQDKTC